MAARELTELERELGIIMIVDCQLGLGAAVQLRSTATVGDALEVARAVFHYPNAPENEETVFELVRHPKGRALPPSGPVPDSPYLYFRWESLRRRRARMAA